MNLYWGGTKLGVAKYRPFDGADPRDAAYDWSLYDRTAHYASAYGIKLLFSITGHARAGRTAARARTGRRATTPILRDFAYAAAARYSGTYTGDGRPDPSRRPAVGGVERAEQPGLPPAPVRPQGRASG